VLAAADSEADAMRRDGEDKRQAVIAKGRRALNEAENVMSPEAMALRAKLAAIGEVQAVIRESAKPLEHISEIKILHVDGLGAGAGAAAAGGAGTPALEGALSDQVMNSALKYKLQAPLVDALLKSAGIKAGTLSDALDPADRGD